MDQLQEEKNMIMLSYNTKDCPPVTGLSSSAGQLSVAGAQVQTLREDIILFGCNMCLKTFYNKNALLNHKNMAHDITDKDNAEEKLCKQNSPSESNARGFKFIPLYTENTDQINHVNKCVIRNFTTDTSYLIVKVEDDGADIENVNKRKLDTIIRNAQQNFEKSSVDLRGPFTCNLPSAVCPDLQCLQIFFSCCEYSLHYREEHTKRRKAALRCQICEKQLDQVSLPNNRQFQTKESFMLSCRICGLKFLDQTALEDHSRSTHTKHKPHECIICFKRFAQQGGLQQHLRMHTGIRPFVCSLCPKTFTQKAGLDQHLRIHTKVKPFKCVICSKCFSQSVHLRQHMRTHTNIQPFECSVCYKRFKQRSHLNFHLRSHMIDIGITSAEHCEEEMELQNETDYFNLNYFK